MKIEKELLDNLMAQALEQAVLASAMGEVPIGAVVYRGGEIIARAHNQMERLKDASAHAEILAMREASHKLGNWRLSDSILCVTLEPCTMCIGALRLARVPVIVFGADDARAGAVGSLYDISLDARLGEVPRVIKGISAQACASVLSEFFSARRKK